MVRSVLTTQLAITTETSHAKNVATLEGLISFCTAQSENIKTIAEPALKNCNRIVLTTAYLE